MKKYYKFLPGAQRKFLLDIASQSGLSTEKLANFVGFSARNYRDWLKEKFAINAGSAKLLSNKFEVPLPEKERILIKRWKLHKRTTGKIGGYACYKKYGNPATPEGRIKGGRKSLKIMREKGIIPEAKEFSKPLYSTSLAEWIGICLGDGGITNSQVQISLNMKADRHYVPFVAKLGEELFKDSPCIVHQYKFNCTKVVHSGVKLIPLLSSMGLKTGNKVKLQVGVPDWIINNLEFSTACLRGLMDTDGGIFRHTYKVNGKEYSYFKLQFSNRSIPLIYFVYFHLIRLGFNPKVFNKMDTKRVWLYNKDETKYYLSVVGTHNKRLMHGG